MKYNICFLAMFVLLFVGCEKDKNNVTTPPNDETSGNIFTSSNIKTAPVYFSFTAKDSVASSAQWDLKLTTLTAPDDWLGQYPFPGIALNSTNGVLGTFVDTKFEDVNPSAVAGLTSDKLDTTETFATASIKPTPIYYSFDKRDTVEVNENWDVEITRDANLFPVFILNKAKGVTAAVVDGMAFENVDAATATGLTTDANDTSLVIGNKLFSYDETTHLLSPYVNRTFILQTINGARVKFKTLDYYSNGASGFVKFQFVARPIYAIGTFCLNYDENTHHLDPFTNRTFVVKTHDGKFVKFKMLTYYNDAGASGYMKFQYEIQ